jgi:hypothetical protein
MSQNRAIHVAIAIIAFEQAHSFLKELNYSQLVNVKENRVYLCCPDCFHETYITIHYNSVVISLSYYFSILFLKGQPK